MTKQISKRQAEQVPKVAWAFGLGAWVRDPLHQRLTSGGIVSDGRGGVRFQPSAGEIVALLGPKPFPAYKIVFGDCENVIAADGANCRECGALSDDEHRDGCLVAPDGFLRRTSHKPGFAPSGSKEGDMVKTRTMGHIGQHGRDCGICSALNDRQIAIFREETLLAALRQATADEAG